MARRRIRRRNLLEVGGVVAIVALGAWWLWPRSVAPSAEDTARDALVAGEQAEAEAESAAPGIDVPEVVFVANEDDAGDAASPDDAADAPDSARQARPDASTELERAETGADAAEAAMNHEGTSPLEPLDVDERNDAKGPAPWMMANAQDESSDAVDRAADPQARPSDSGAASARTIPGLRARYANGEALEARRELNRMLHSSADERAKAELRRALREIADEMIFSKKRFKDDPLIQEYRIESGDNLVNIGREYGVPADALMTINTIVDARRIQAGQIIKVPRQPFNARIDKSEFRMDLYLGDTYLRSFPVGLGTDDGTPVGAWKVRDRLKNPTYYPPPGSPLKRIVGPDDPENPLGGFWIGLEGVEGDAVGQLGYGIHGTNEPDSIGKNASLGCVRMPADDIAFVFKLMQPGSSTVTTEP